MNTVASSGTFEQNEEACHRVACLRCQEPHSTDCQASCSSVRFKGGSLNLNLIIPPASESRLACPTVGRAGSGDNAV